jgi:hypothetical protein
MVITQFFITLARFPLGAVDSSNPLDAADDVASTNEM